MPAVPAKEGYVAPPLVGVWASAPVLPQRIGADARHRAELGTATGNLVTRQPRSPCLRSGAGRRCSISWYPRAEFEKSAAAAAGKSFLSQAAIDHGANYDTKEFGHGNMGHTFGDRLTAEERRGRDRIPQEPFGTGYVMSSVGGGGLPATFKARKKMRDSNDTSTTAARLPDLDGSLSGHRPPSTVRWL